MLRILEEISAGRQESMTELRTDISALAQALSQPRGQERIPARSRTQDEAE
jgi:Skp family chaperone for outer membrane proteins